MPHNLSLHFVPVLPLWVVALVVVSLLGMLIHGCLVLRRKQIPPRWNAILGTLRVLMIALFALLLLQPVLSFTQTVRRLPELLVLVDRSASMGQPAAENATRLQEVTRSLDTSGLAAEMSRRFQVRWFAFDGNAAPLEGAEWTNLEPTGETTRFADSLSTAWNYPRLDSPSDGSAPPLPERVLLVSDGLDRGSPGIIETAQSLGVPIDVLPPSSSPMGKQSAPIAVADVQAAPRVLLGSETHFLITLRGARLPADRRMQIHLAESGKEIDAAEVIFHSGRTEERVRLAHRPTEVGLKRFSFHITGPGQEASPAFPVSVQAIDGKHEVLVLEDTWRWEFKFLRRVLEEDPSFRFTALLSRGNGAFLEFAAPDRRSQLVGYPQNRSQLVGFDTVILGDVNPRRWPRDLAASLHNLVSEEGKSLIVVAGPNLANWTESADLLALLPVEISRETGNPINGPVELRISPEGARSAFFSQPGGGAASAKLPALDQIYPPLRKKPAAAVLLEAATLANAYGPLIVLAEHTVGRGRVLYVGTDTLWKWQTLTTAASANTTPYHQFWRQSLRALAPTRPGGTAASLWLQPRRSRIEAGQTAAIRAEIESPTAMPHATIQGVMTLPDGRSLPLTFTLDPTAGSAYQAEFQADLAGSYRVNASVQSEGKSVAEGAAAIEVEEAKPERGDAPVDMVNLTRIASSTGGQIIDTANPETWPVSQGQETVVVERRAWDLWNRGILLCMLAAIAGLDWLLRLLRGYV